MGDLRHDGRDLSLPGIGVVLMSRVRITRRVERALRALPGCIVMATIVPIAADGGAAAILGLGATILVMAICKIELVALAAALAPSRCIRALGL